MTTLYTYRGEERTLEAIAASEGVTCQAIKSRWTRYGRTEKLSTKRKLFDYNGAKLTAVEIAHAEGISESYVKRLFRLHGRIKRRNNTAKDFLIQCIKLHPMETGESIVNRVMTVAPSKWSKSTLISFLSKLRSENRIVAKPYSHRKGNDRKTMVYALSETVATPDRSHAP